MDESLSTQQLLVRRRITRALADHLTRILNGYLVTLAPLLTPRSVLGAHVRGGGAAASKAADEAMAQLSSEYAAVRRSKPFNLRSQFDTPIEIMGATPAIAPVEYDYRANSDAASKDVRVVSPFRWVLSYSGFAAEQLRALVARPDNTTDARLQQCVLHQLAMFVVLSKRDGVRQLLEALQFPVSFEHQDEFGKLPMAVLHCPLSTFLPSDQVVIESTELSGAPRFEEVVDLEKAVSLEDPFKEPVIGLIREHGDAEVEARLTR